MRHKKIDLNLLIALKVLLTEKNVTKSSEKLHITQPSMSGVLSRLRKCFDDPLLIQVGRNMELTSYAESLLGPLSDALTNIDAMLENNQHFNPAESHRHFRIIASDYITTILLSKLFILLSTEAPDITVEITPPSSKSAKELEAGDIDFLIAPLAFTSSKHPYELVFKDSYKIIADTNNSILGETIDLTQYFSHQHVTFINHQVHNVAQDWFANKHDDRRQQAITTHFFGLLPYLLLGTNRIATMNTRLAIHYSNILPLKVITPLFNIPPILEVLQWNSQRNPDTGISWLRNKIIDTANTLQSVESLELRFLKT